MKSTLFTLACAAVPAFVSAPVASPAGAQAKAQVDAQAQAQAGARARTQASAQAAAKSQVSFDAPRGWSAEGAAKLSAMYDDARKKDLPPEPIARRVAEGSAKGASESTILASAATVQANLEASHEAMVAAGRPRPAPQESERAAMLMERGVTKAQLAAMVRHAPSDRSLVVAFDVLGRLVARGVPVTKALAQVQTKLEARASDQAMLGLVGKGTASAGGAAAGGPGAAAGAGVGAAASGTVTGATRGVGTTVTGTVGGVVRRP